ncbi:hypothetical protein KY334_01770 [Candidatus Woesearchaeota archaeon]|nr:hypothetical protein [Candidatus Woesearchaeota archaeon]
MKARNEKFENLYPKFLDISRGNEIVAYNVTVLLSDYPISLRRELAQADTIIRGDGSSITPIHLTFEYLNGKIIGFSQKEFGTNVRYANSAGMLYSCSPEDFITLENFEIFQKRFPCRRLARRNLEESVGIFNEFNESFNI